MDAKKKSTTAATTMEPPNARSPRLTNTRRVQNFLLVWLDRNIDEINNEDCCNFIKKLRQVVNSVNTFIDVNKCIDFITGIKEEKIFMISSGTLGQTTVPIVHDMVQVDTIYIFCGNKPRHEKWAHQWSKIKGVYTDIAPIFEELKKAAQDCDQNFVSITLVKKTHEASNQNLNELDQSFMYMHILKEILLSINFEQVHIHKFLTYCREQFTGNTIELKTIDKLEKEYHVHQPIWWYTYDCFLYSMLNRALRTMEIDLITKMGFFILDLHNDIAVLHSEQYARQNLSNSFIVYRGQSLSQKNFQTVMKTKGGLLAFNNFLFTSKIRDVSLDFARRTMATSSLVGVLFVMTIDPSISSAPFANVRSVSAYETEQEILFSMHSVFRIGQIKQIDGKDRLWQVDLILIGDSDPQLHALTELMRKETKGSTGWLRLGKLMVKAAEFDKAEDFYERLLAETTNERDKGDIYYQLGWVKTEQGQYREAITFYENSLQIRQNAFTSQHPAVAECYNEIALLYESMGEPLKALSSYEKALKIYQKALPSNHPDLATSYNNIGGMYDEMGEYSKALSSYEKALEIREKRLPANHPDLATSYNNVGLVYDEMSEYSKALSYYEKALEIRQKTLPTNHPHLASSYNNIGLLYAKMGEYSKALSSHEKALEIRQKTLPSNHPHLATSYACHGSVYEKMGEYSKALSFYEKALEIQQNILPANHPDFAQSYNNIGTVYYYIGEYSKSLTYCERALNIWQDLLPPNHSHLKTVRKNIEMVKKKL